MLILALFNFSNDTWYWLIQCGDHLNFLFIRKVYQILCLHNIFFQLEFSLNIEGLLYHKVLLYLNWLLHSLNQVDTYKFNKHLTMNTVNISEHWDTSFDSIRLVDPCKWEVYFLDQYSCDVFDKWWKGLVKVLNALNVVETFDNVKCWVTNLLWRLTIFCCDYVRCLWSQLVYSKYHFNVDIHDWCCKK